MSTENVSDNTKKAQKRSKPDHDISLEEKNHFQRSKLTPRSPVKVRVPKEIRSILMELKKEFKEDLAEIKKEIRTEITQMRKRKEREDEKQNLMQKLKSSDEKYEKMKRNLIRNNIIITGLKVDVTDEKIMKQAIESMIETHLGIKVNTKTGLKVDVTDEKIMKQAIESMIETHLGIKVNTKKVYKIDKKRCVAELADRDEKIKILKVKSKLKGKDIYIYSELTFEERSIQRKIRDKAREERNRGARVRVKYQQLEVNGKRMIWDNMKHALVKCDEPKN
ncbi:hypothetical protein QE152_g26757 [Popillia japonica]|uniref:Uncharacterized protein n=1 Tax=Popillia japonica TaxID=7064 RepID=A0AAW1JVU8_POPJA